jgi:hypothetical protein
MGGVFMQSVVSNFSIDSLNQQDIVLVKGKTIVGVIHRLVQLPNTKISFEISLKSLSRSSDIKWLWLKDTDGKSNKEFRTLEDTTNHLISLYEKYYGVGVITFKKAKFGSHKISVYRGTKVIGHVDLTADKNYWKANILALKDDFSSDFLELKDVSRSKFLKFASAEEAIDFISRQYVAYYG